MWVASEATGRLGPCRRAETESELDTGYGPWAIDIFIARSGIIVTVLRQLLHALTAVAEEAFRAAATEEARGPAGDGRSARPRRHVPGNGHHEEVRQQRGNSHPGQLVQEGRVVTAVHREPRAEMPGEQD